MKGRKGLGAIDIRIADSIIIAGIGQKRESLLHMLAASARSITDSGKPAAAGRESIHGMRVIQGTAGKTRKQREANPYTHE